jgi:hypothetical protein
MKMRETFGNTLSQSDKDISKNDASFLVILTM